jgi:glycosyltransferase involved in cell wall biosynthesis
MNWSPSNQAQLATDPPQPADNGPRILQFVSDLDVGGAQEVVRTLAEHLTAARCPVVVCALRGGPLRRDIEGLGIPVIILPDRRNSIVAFPAFVDEMIRLRRTLAGLIRRYEIDVIQTHLLRSLDFLALSLKAGQDVKVYWTFHNANFDLRRDHLRRHRWLYEPKRRTHHWLYRFGAKWVDGLIAVSPEVKTAMLTTLALPADKITVINNGVDPRRYRPTANRDLMRRRLGLAEGDRAIAVVATLKEQKGHRYLIEAAAAVLPQFPNAHFWLIGDGELRQALAEQIAANRLEQNVHLLGTRHDVPALLAASDLFVLPSLWEGLPMALVEAMAGGLPVVATEVSGTRQVMVDGETGLLVPPGNAARLARAIALLLADPARAALMGAAGRRRIETLFSARQQAAEHLALFAPGKCI